MAHNFNHPFLDCFNDCVFTTLYTCDLDDSQEVENFIPQTENSPDELAKLAKKFESTANVNTPVATRRSARTPRKTPKYSKI